VKSFWIVREHRVQIRRDEIAEALSIAPLSLRRGRMSNDER